MPISPDQYTDPNARRYSLPTDSCVGDGVGDPHAGGKPAAKPSAASMAAPSGGDPYAGGKSVRSAAQGGSVPTVMSGPDLPADNDTDDPSRY